MRDVVKFFRANPQAFVLLVICVVLGLGTFLAVLFGLITASPGTNAGEPSGAVLGAGALRGPTSGVAYYEARDGARGPRPVSVASATTAGRGGQSLPARIWLVTRRSDTPPQLQQKLQNTLARSYTKVGPQADFRNLIVVLYRR